MAVPSEPRLDNYVVEVEVEIPAGVAFAHPEDGISPQDEEILKAFLLDFEKKHEPPQGVGLFPVEQDE